MNGLNRIASARFVAGFFTVFSIVTALSLQAQAQSPSPSPAQPRDIANRIAEAAGSSSFLHINALHYTFNVQLGDKHIVRRWVWWPKERKVRLIREEDAGVTLEYSRDLLRDSVPQAFQQVDQWFVNDQYWLLFPLHLAWDSGIELESIASVLGPAVADSADGDSADAVSDVNVESDAGEEAGPVSPHGHGLRVRYPAQGGYTPGDVYDLFFDAQHNITRWIFRKGGSTTPTRITRWQDYRRFGPLTLSLERLGEEDGFRVWFTDVRVE